MEENNVLTDTEELKILSDLVAIKSVNDNEILVAKYLQKLLGARLFLVASLIVDILVQ